jgi:phosphate-selective porin OprO/OprP
VFGQDLRGREAGTGVAARAVHAHESLSGRLIHLAIAAAIENPAASRAKLGARPETALGDLPPSGPGSISDVRARERIGIEAAVRHEAWLLQSELASLALRRDDAPAVDAHGGYLSLSRILTGESHGYTQGVFTGVTPERSWGAIEASLRYSRIVFDADATRERQSSLSAGLVWHLGNDRRLMLNHVSTRFRARLESNSPLHLLEARFQWIF